MISGLAPYSPDLSSGGDSAPLTPRVGGSFTVEVVLALVARATREGAFSGVVRVSARSLVPSRERSASEVFWTEGERSPGAVSGDAVPGFAASEGGGSTADLIAGRLS